MNMPRKDVLVMMGTISFGLLILMPLSLSARSSGKSALCLANLHLLGRAWLAYADDNGGRIVGGSTGSTAAPYYSWVEWPSNSAVPELQEKMRAISAGKLFPYVGTVQAYHCPQDNRYLLPSRDPGSYGFEIGGFRSYSIVGGMKGVDEYGGWEIVPHVSTATIQNPAGKCVFVEEAEGRGDNAGSWVMYPRSRGWVDPFAVWHNQRSTLGFADGHAEIHPWIDKSTIDMSKNQTFFQSLYPTDSGMDLAYMIQVYPYSRLL
jgi:prepilin-type processing-associated H-X9-DG protein